MTTTKERMDHAIALFKRFAVVQKELTDRVIREMTEDRERITVGDINEAAWQIAKLQHLDEMEDRDAIKELLGE